MDTGVADKDEEPDAEEKLGDAREVERSRVREDRHGDWENDEGGRDKAEKLCSR